MDEHLSSYDHHHTKRLKEARAAERARTRDKRERQEAKRAAREQARLDAQCALLDPLPASLSCGAPGVSMAVCGMDLCASANAWMCESMWCKSHVHLAQEQRCARCWCGTTVHDGCSSSSCLQSSDWSCCACRIAAAHGSGTAAPALPSMPAATPSPAVAGSSGAAAHSEPVHADTGWHASDAARHSTPAKRSRWDARPAPTPASASVHNAQAGAASTGDSHNDPQPPLPPEDEPNVAAGWVQQHQPTSAGALAGARPMQPAQHARQASTHHAASNGTAFGQSAHRWASSAPLLPGSPLPPQSGDASGPKQPLQQHHAARHDVAHEWAGPAAWHSRAKPPSASGLGFSMGAQNPDRPLDTHLASQVAQATAGVAAQDAPQAPKQAVVQAKKGRMASMFGGSDDDD